MEEYDYLIVGGGLAAASAVSGIRQADEAGTIALLSEEEEPPYHRPPLSKEYLQVPEATRELLHVKPESWYGETADVDLLLGRRATALEPREMTVGTADGDRIRADRILLATGGRPRTLAIPGIEHAGVFTLRTAADAEAIREAAGEAERAVLVGGGFIGMELAASLRELGVRSTVVELEDRVWSRMLPPELSRWMQAYFEDRGVEFRLGSRVEELRGAGDEGGVAGALLDDGSELECQFVVVGVGIEPNDELAADAGLGVKDGIVVDDHGETSHGYIYATGDVVRFPDPVFGDLTRVEHWDHAKTHGRLVGRNMARQESTAYDHLSYFFSEVFDLSLNVFGRPAEADRMVVRGDLEGGEAVVFCGSEGRLCATILLNQSDALEECRELVRKRPRMEDLAPLSDPRADLAEFPS